MYPVQHADDGIEVCAVPQVPADTERTREGAIYLERSSVGRCEVQESQTVMRIWKRAEYQRQCGKCGGPIYREQPYLEFTSAAWTKPKRRCRNCADDEPPKGLPPLAVEKPKRDPLPMTRFSADMLPLDFKLLQGNDK